VTFHNLWSGGQLTLLFRVLLPFASWTLCVSEAVRASLAQSGLALPRCQVIPNGVDLDAFSPAPELACGKFTVAFVGRLTEEKGVPELLAAAEILAKRGVVMRFLIAGDGPLREQVESHPLLQDGTLVYLVTTTTPRWWISTVRVLFAATLTALLSATAVIGTGLLATGTDDPLGVTRAFAIATAFGGATYAALFTALAVLTRRALVTGLGYVLFWEGILSTTFPGIHYLSIRQWMLADPEVNASSPSFGRIRTSNVNYTPRNIQLGLRLDF
jgi:hypothetical protein